MAIENLDEGVEVGSEDSVDNDSTSGVPTSSAPTSTSTSPTSPDPQYTREQIVRELDELHGQLSKSFTVARSDSRDLFLRMIDLMRRITALS